MAGITASAQELEPSLAARLRGGKRPVRSEDLDVYAAIVGRAPTTQERQWALTESGNAGAAVLTPPAPTGPGGWLERSLGLSIHLNRPQFAAWMRKVSNDARQCLRSCQSRFRS